MHDYNTLAPISLEDPEAFLVDDREQVRHFLIRLTKHPELVCLYPDQHREPFALSALLHVTEDYLTFDASPDERTNKVLLNTPYMRCISSLSRVHIQFNAMNPEAVQHEGRRAIRTLFPESLLYVQRRDYFRLSIPGRQPLYCRIPQGDHDFIEAEIADISLGGISLLGPLPSLLLLPGMRLAGCQIDLPEVGCILADLLVCATRDIGSRTSQRNLRIGCRFIHLANREQTLVQRYINRIERSRISYA